MLFLMVMLYSNIVHNCEKIVRKHAIPIEKHGPVFRGTLYYKDPKIRYPHFWKLP